jgi:uncharacterized membrane protein YphA (DoxX/SURF4 family)
MQADKAPGGIRRNTASFRHLQKRRLVDIATLEILGGMALLLGYYSRWAAAALAGFVALATVIFHGTPDQRVHLLKNLAIIGGLLLVLLCESHSDIPG